METRDDGDSPLERLACADEDAHGRSLDVYWDNEIDRKILAEEGWANLAARGFDHPRYFSAFLHTVRWNWVTSTDAKLVKTPIRADAKLDSYQIDPWAYAESLPQLYRQRWAAARIGERVREAASSARDSVRARFNRDPEQLADERVRREVGPDAQRLDRAMREEREHRQPQWEVVSRLDTMQWEERERDRREQERAREQRYRQRFRQPSRDREPDRGPSR